MIIASSVIRNLGQYLPKVVSPYKFNVPFTILLGNKINPVTRKVNTAPVCKNIGEIIIIRIKLKTFIQTRSRHITYIK